MKKVIIGGGTGFIGTRLIKQMTENGYESTVLSRMPGPNNVSWQNLSAIGLPKQTSVVVNLAGQNIMDLTKRWTPGFKQNVVNSRINTTSALSRAIKEVKDKPKVFVLVTGVGAYVPSETTEYTEASEVTGQDFFSQLVLDWEGAAAVEPPVRLVVIRSGVVLGRKGGMIKNMYAPFWLGLGGRIASGTQYLPWIHVDDLTSLISYAVENEEVVGVLNGVAPQVITNAEFTKAFAQAIRRPAAFPVPEGVLNYMLGPERASMMTRGQKVKPKKVLDYGFQFKYGNIYDACRQCVLEK